MDSEYRILLKKKFKGDKKGFKIYIAGELKNSTESESGKGYWFEEPFSPGFSILTGTSAGSGRLMAHEITHGLGCLKDVKDDDDNLMKPTGRPAGDDTKLMPEQCKPLRECASQSKK